MNLKKAVAAVALTAATSVGGVVVSESTPVSAHGDACTNAPDSGPFWNFHDSCHRHDDCYAQAVREQPVGAAALRQQLL